jgi:hypothetical protein
MARLERAAAERNCQCLGAVRIAPMFARRRKLVSATRILADAHLRPPIRRSTSASASASEESSAKLEFESDAPDDVGRQRARVHVGDTRGG